MLFTLYGDYIYHRGGEIWVGSLIRLLATCGSSEQAVRSELMRMCRRGYLTVRRAGKRSFYSLSPEGLEVIEAGARRIFYRREEAWDGRWSVLTYSIPEQQREARGRLRRDLMWLGFGPLTPGVYLSPWDLAAEVAGLVRRYGRYGQVQSFRADNAGPADDQALVQRCWDLAQVNLAYEKFLARWAPRLESFQQGRLAPSDEEAFAERFLLAHAYDRFPLTDPGLPRELVPAGWLGDEAAAVFRAYHDALAPAAVRFFDSVYVGWPEGD